MSCGLQAPLTGGQIELCSEAGADGGHCAASGSPCGPREAFKMGMQAACLASIGVDSTFTLNSLAYFIAVKMELMACEAVQAGHVCRYPCLSRAPGIDVPCRCSHTQPPATSKPLSPSAFRLSATWLTCECRTRTQPESLISMFSASVKAPPAGGEPEGGRPGREDSARHHRWAATGCGNPRMPQLASRHGVTHAGDARGKHQHRFQHSRWALTEKQNPGMVGCRPRAGQGEPAHWSARQLGEQRAFLLLQAPDSCGPCPTPSTTRSAPLPATATTCRQSSAQMLRCVRLPPSPIVMILFTRLVCRWRAGSGHR